MKSTREVQDRLSEVLISMGANAAFVEELFHDYLNNPTSVAESWRDFLQRFAQTAPENLVAFSDKCA